MKRFIHMGKYYLSIIWVLLLMALIVSCESNKELDYNTPPEYVKEMGNYFDSLNLKPVRVFLYDDTVFVSYTESSRIDLFTTEFDYIKTIDLINPEQVFPTNFVIDDTLIIVADHTKGALVVYDRKGNFQNSFGLLPDQKTRMSPFGLAFHRGVIYSGDAALRQIMVISYSDAPGVTEIGELLFSFPNDTSHSIGFPSALHVTYDGRLLVGDASKNKIFVYTCDGRYIYNFDSLPGYGALAPLGITMDRKIDPSMQDSTSFDPSGIRIMGRFHVTDGNNNIIHMYNPLGKYISSYPDDKRLQKPSGITYDTKRKLIYIADPVAGKIFAYKMIE